MNLVVRDLPDCYGCDTIYVFNDASSARLKAAKWLDPTGVPRALDFLWRYLMDVSPEEFACNLRCGWACGYVLHVDRPSWQAQGAKGHLRGLAAAQKAQRLGILPTTPLPIDMEGVGDPGTNADAYVRECSKPIFDAGFTVPMYEGYDDGFVDATRAALVTDRAVSGLWSDFAARHVLPGIGFFCKQYPQTMVAGVQIDPDHAYPDLRGVVLRMMMDADVCTLGAADPLLPGDGQAAAGQSGDPAA